MPAFLAILRRCWYVPHMLPLCVLVSLVAALTHWLGVRELGAADASLAELRAGLVLGAGLLHLGLCTPLALRDETKAGLITLRRARGVGPGLWVRAAAVFVSMLPVCVLVIAITTGLPSEPLAVLLSLAAWVALGLALGTWLSGAALRTTLWIAGGLSLFRGVLLSDEVARVLAWLLPPLPAPGVSLWPVALWIVGALLLAEWRVNRVRV
ncbi:MAG: hypothetical protein DHS20C15_22610 [Planctomycetota bacterium]|nr:MAG: hypothetical protein DHS20C15_22610 [Planctomycetota bacterium]